MKTKPYHHYLIPLAILATLLFLGSCSKKETQQTNQPPLAREYPNEWMYNQRAYPHNYINKKAINEAVAQSRSILGARAPQENDWELVGPLNTGGRITDIALSPNNDDVFYAATAVGGVFKTTNGGAAWEPIFDDIAKASIGDIALAPSNPQILYVGTGEANGSGTSGAFFGDGIYRSEDAGASFTNIGLDGTDHIGRIVIDPTDPDRVFVAATGKLYGKNEDRGIYRTTN
ncbi:MAG: WD40/YVTN/BNR-like repeat-containing protein, partial [Marinirhabdus sp.]